jgi:hypothetical protein
MNDTDIEYIFETICNAYLTTVKEAEEEGGPVITCFWSDMKKYKAFDLNTDGSHSPADEVLPLLEGLSQTIGKPDMYVFCSECYIGEGANKEDVKKKYKYGELKDDPKSSEGVLIVGAKNGDKRLVRTYSLIRTEKDITIKVLDEQKTIIGEVKSKSKSKKKNGMDAPKFPVEW